MSRQVYCFVIGYGSHYSLLSDSKTKSSERSNSFIAILIWKTIWCRQKQNVNFFSFPPSWNRVFMKMWSCSFDYLQCFWYLFFLTCTIYQRVLWMATMFIFRILAVMEAKISEMQSLSLFCQRASKQQDLIYSPAENAEWRECWQLPINMDSASKL